MDDEDREQLKAELKEEIADELRAEMRQHLDDIKKAAIIAGAGAAATYHLGAEASKQEPTHQQLEPPPGARRRYQGWIGPAVVFGAVTAGAKKAVDHPVVTIGVLVGGATLFVAGLLWPDTTNPGDVTAGPTVTATPPTATETTSTPSPTITRITSTPVSDTSRPDPTPEPGGQVEDQADEQAAEPETGPSPDPTTPPPDIDDDPPDDPTTAPPEEPDPPEVARRCVLEVDLLPLADLDVLCITKAANRESETQGRPTR